MDSIMLVRNITQKIEITHEPGEWALIRRLTWKQLQHAQEVRSDNAIAKMKTTGGELVKVMDELAADARRRREEAAKDGAQTAVVVTPNPKLFQTTYDLATVLADGVANLSYVEKFETKDVDDLDPKTAEFIGSANLDLSGVGETEADQKNG